MAKQFVVVFCEGNHDVMFLYRVLKTHGYKSYNRKLKEFPYPLNEFLINEVQQTSVEELNLEQARVRLIPTEVLSKDDDKLIIMYAMGGDSKSIQRKQIIDTLSAIVTDDPEAIQVVSDVNISLVYFFDADKRGVVKRVEEINKEIGETIKKDFEPLTKHCDVTQISNLKIGVFIFTKAESDEGKLEDLILPMMESENEEIFEAARQFLNLNQTVPLFRDHLTRDESGAITKVLKKDFDLKKSLIGITGQLQISGKPNGVYIRESAFLNENKIKGNEPCNGILSFFNAICQ